MKSKTTVFAALLAAAVMALFAPRQARADVTFSYFYEGLIPYGDWVDVDQYGYCWAPRGMAADWRPYTDGYWTYTDAGWTWVSYEDFGSITYHYGRWVRLEDVGWVWKPDYRWGPAWVSWRQSDNYMGWAPLPPDVSFNDDSGVGVWVDRDYDIGPSSYTFCETRYFGAPVMRNVIVPVRRNVEILDMTVNITNITFINSHDHGRLVYCGGPDYRWLAARSERPINRLELVLRKDGDWLHRRRPELSRSVGAQLFIDAPVIAAPRERFAPPRVAREIRAPRIDRGWGSVADPGMRERIHQRYQEQTRGLTRQTAPAYRVNEAEVRNFVREPRPVPSGAPGAVQTMQQNVQRAPQQVQQTIQQPQQRDQIQRNPVDQQQRQALENARNQQRQQQDQIQRNQADQQQRQAAENARNQQRQQQDQIQRNQADQQQRQAAENARNQQRQQDQIQRNQADQQQRQAAENARNQQRQQQEQIQRNQADQQQRQAAENARNQQRQQEQIQRNQAEQQQRQAAENARNQQRQQDQIQRNQAEQQQRQAAENARNQQRQQDQIQRNQADQQQRQAAENARNQQRQAMENARNQQRQQEQQFQRRENAAPQGPQSSSSRDNRDNNDHKKHDRLNDPNNGN